MKLQKDPLFGTAVKQWEKYGQQYNTITISFFQRRLGIGYVRAERLVKQLKKTNALDITPSRKHSWWRRIFYFWNK